jgi:arginase
MNDFLLCLSPEWQGCESPVLQQGATILAKELFGARPYVEISTSKSDEPNVTDGVFALDTIVDRFIETLNVLQTRYPKRIMTIGGSCGTEAAPVAFLNEVHERKMAVVWFDAHGDLNTPDSSPSGHFHGMVLRTLLGEGPEALTRFIRCPLVPHQVFIAGVRDLDEKEQEYLDKSHITVAQADEQLVGKISGAGFKKIYIHLDVDVINPLSFTDALMPTAGGPTVAELTQCFSALAKTFKVVGIGIVEYCGRHPRSSAQIAKLIQKSGITSQSSGC